MGDGQTAKAHVSLDELHEQWSDEDRQYREASEEQGMVHRVALRVLYLRKARGWTQEELAERMGVTQSAVANLEGGYENPSVKRLVRIARALDVDPEDLVSEDEPEMVRGRELVHA